MNEKNASDLYLTVGRVPTIRVDDELYPLTETPLSPESINEIINSILTTKQRRDFELNWDLNTSLDMGDYGRFRINVMKQRQSPGLVVRRIISKIPAIRDSRLPPVLENLALEMRGLI